jgi:hypothetical protein
MIHEQNSYASRSLRWTGVRQTLSCEPVNKGNNIRAYYNTSFDWISSETPALMTDISRGSS